VTEHIASARRRFLEDMMFIFWRKLSKAPVYRAVSGKHHPAVIVQMETFHARAKRLDTDGSRRRLRQIAEENRLL
jgi:hypothetical protein